MDWTHVVTERNAHLSDEKVSLLQPQASALFTGVGRPRCSRIARPPSRLLHDRRRSRRSSTQPLRGVRPAHDSTAAVHRVAHDKGPHPQEYHEDVYRRLRDAMQGCRSINQCKDSLKRALKELADEISMEGSKLNKLVTRNE
jgi:hypothetical protein